MVTVVSRGKTIATQTERGTAGPVRTTAGAAAEIEMEVMVPNPELWSPEVSV